MRFKRVVVARGRSAGYHCSIFHTHLRHDSRDSFIIAASHFVISQAALLAHVGLVLLALARRGRRREKDWRLEHRQKSEAPNHCTDQRAAWHISRQRTESKLFWAR